MKKQPVKYPRRCATKRCRGVVVSRACHSDKCPKCNWRIYVEKNPLKAAFKTIRNHAKERGKDFSLTFEQFESFALNTNYIARKGRTTLSFHIHRVDNSIGYCAGNIACVTLLENNRAQFTKMPQWMKDEIKACENGHIPESHRDL